MFIFRHNKSLEPPRLRKEWGWVFGGLVSNGCISECENRMLKTFDLTKTHKGVHFLTVGLGLLFFYMCVQSTNIDVLMYIKYSVRL